MQILVLSDTHGDYAALKSVVQEHPDVALILHCGDGQHEVDRLLFECPETGARLRMVRGNCDHSQELPELRTVPLPYGHRALMVHGHRFVGGDLYVNLAANAQANGCDIVFFGHLHRRIEKTVGGIRLFNPGSAAQPRDGQPPSFGLVDILDSGILMSHGSLPDNGLPHFAL